jgi:hypothetical protein
MASERVRPDEWTWLLHPRLRFFLRQDALMDEDSRPVLDFGIFPGPDEALSLGPDVEMLEVRTKAAMPATSMPAGWRLQFVYGKRLYLPGVEARLRRVDTAEFRRPDPEGDMP